MPAESSPDVKLEIGHVLFLDIVGYSRLLINEQSEQIQKLKEIVRGTEQVRLAEAEGKLLRLPTGDGGALVFHNSPETPVLCALEISNELKKHPELRVRMGIHSGPVNEVTDLNAQANIAGAGINIAQRVMDCGDAGHILLSRHVAEDLESYGYWQPQLHDLGECEVKHGVRLGLVNLYANGIGNPQLPRKFQALQKRSARKRWATMAAALLALAAIVAGIAMFSRSRGPSTLSAPEKSIAVLPFENLSSDKENADFGNDYYFARRCDEAIAQLRKTIEMEPHSYLAHYYLGQALQLKGQVSEAIAEYRKAVELDDDPFALALLGQSYARTGRRDDANKILAQLSQEAKARYVSAYGIGLVFLGMGDKTRAMDEMERAYREDAGTDVYNIRIDPMVDELRGDPRFEALAEKILPARDFKGTTASK